MLHVHPVHPSCRMQCYVHALLSFFCFSPLSFRTQQVVHVFGTFLLERAHVTGMLASVLVKPAYSAAKPAQELRTSLNFDPRSFVQSLPQQAPLALNGVEIRRVLREALNDRATSFAQGSNVAGEYKDTTGTAPKVGSQLRSEI